ncbi:MAG: basic secretory protein-like protein [Capsulimonadales bacterium]|nr:basic secretory protein-like protein [Capsulimonadales bacterium]
MLKLLLTLSLVLGIVGTVRAQAAGGNAAAGPIFEADTREVPELQPWGRAAEALCVVWYPRIVAILYDGNMPAPPSSVRLYFKKEMDGVAFADGTKIQIAAPWIRKSPNDFGMVIHELTHIVQAYPNYDAGWLVEGIADYVRLKFFEPQLPAPKIDFSKAKYTDSYKTTAVFLIRTEEKYDVSLVRKLNAALKAGKYDDTLFKTLTGKDLPTLWAEFAAEYGRKDAPVGP